MITEGCFSEMFGALCVSNAQNAIYTYDCMYIYRPGTLNNHFLMDVWWNNHFYVEIWNHPIETTIKNWLFGVPCVDIHTLLAVLIPNFQQLDSAEPPETSKNTNPTTFYWVVVSHTFSCFTPTWATWG